MTCNGIDSGTTTNTLRITLSPDLDLHKASALLREFGDIALLELARAAAPVVIVAFFDVRSAVRAHQAFGSQNCCYLPQTGPRSLRLPGTVKLDVEEMKGVSDVKNDAEDSSAFIVEFYDVRECKRIQERQERVTDSSVPPVQKAEKKKKKNSNTASPAHAQLPGSQVAPAYVNLDYANPYRLSKPSASYTDASMFGGYGGYGNTMPGFRQAPAQAKPFPSSSSASSGGEGCCVLISGLPKALCHEDNFEVMLEQAGLENHVVSLDMHPGEPVGEAYITFASPSFAKQCVRHFHGRKWDPTGVAVTACFAKGEAGSTQPKVAKATVAKSQKAAKSAALKPQKDSWCAAMPVPDLVSAPEIFGQPEATIPLPRWSSRKDELRMLEGHMKNASVTRTDRFYSGAKEHSLSTDESTADGASEASEREDKLVMGSFAA